MPAAADGLANRRREYIDWILDHFGALEPTMEPRDGRQWALSHARLLRGRDVDRANAHLNSISLPGDPDIYFIRYLKTLLDFESSPRLAEDSRRKILDILLAWPENERTTVAKWPPAHTENHDLLQMTICLFKQQHQGRDISNQVGQIQQSLAWRFERGWIEWNSAWYQFHYSNPLFVLADHAPTSELRRTAEALLNLLLAERAVLGVNGYLGGPSFRCRTADANHSLTARKVAYLEDARYDGFLPTVWLAFGLGEPRFNFDHARVTGLVPATVHYASTNEPRLKQDEGMFCATSRFVPHPLVRALAAESATRPELVYTGQRYLGWPGETMNETHWRGQPWMPAALSYYNTPHVSMASVHSSGWICQSRYDQVIFGADPSQGLRVEIMLPDEPPHKRRYEARGRVVQHRNWLLGQGTLFEDGGITARRIGEWDLYRVGHGLCAHSALPEQYHVLQVSDLDHYPNEDAFIAALSPPRMDGQTVTGTVLNGDRVVVDLEDMAMTINGTVPPHPPRMLHACSAMQSEYGSGRITVRTGQGTLALTPRAPWMALGDA